MSASKGALLFVHGMCHGPWCWEEAFIPYFERRGYQCLAVTLEGHHEGNENSINRVGLSDFDRNLQEAINHFSEPPVLIGHSMGGMVVQRYLKTGRCEKAILLASVPPDGVLKASVRILTKYYGAWKYLLIGDLLGFARAYDHLFFGRKITDHQRQAFKKMLCAESFKAFLQLILPLKNVNYKGQLLVLGGEEDEIFTSKEIEQTARKYGADLDIIAGASHDLMLDHNRLEVAKSIHRWLER